MTALRGFRPTPRTVLAAVVAFFALALPALAGPYEELQENARQRAELEAKLQQLEVRSDKLSSKVASADSAVATAQSQVDALDTKLSRLGARIDKVRADLVEALKRIALLTRELQEILLELDERIDAFSDRAVAAYVAGPTAYLEGILSSHTFSDLIARVAYYEAALNSDSEMVQEIQQLRDQTEARRELVEQKRAQIVRAKARLEADRAQIAAVRRERAAVLAQRREALAAKRGLLAQVESSKSRYLRMVTQLDADSAQLRALLAGSSSGTVRAGGQLLWPANGPVTSGYGYRTHPIYGDRRFHAGIDIGAPYGAQVVAADGGVVAYAGVMSGYGNVVTIDHGGGLATVYAHLSSFSVGSGQSVNRGSPIAAVGCTGYCTGPHLHFEVRINGDPVDPMPYLQ